MLLGTSPVIRMSTGLLGADHSEEFVCTIASVLVPMEATHRAQREVDLREPSLGLLARSLGDVTPCLLAQRKFIIDDIRVTLESQVLSRVQSGTLPGQEQWLSGHPWK
jgi:hypothetical protein